MNIVNIATRALKSSSTMSLKGDEKKFIHDVSTLLAPRGLTPSVGRVYAYLLLKQHPVSLDQIADDLEISKVSAWNAAKALEVSDHVRRQTVPGSKRVLYAPSDNFGSPLMEQAAVLGTMGKLLQNCASNVAAGKAAAALKKRAHFYFAIQDVMEHKIAELNAQRNPGGE